jgi:NAD(P)-dependent dehydrogenase (short-subunit alcohol dehydrogenase family)
MTMQFDFSGKRVLVTGSTMGIGRGAAEGFHSLGATVAINGRTVESVSRTIGDMGGGPRLVSAPGDLSSMAVIERTIERLLREMRGLDILVNNAGRGDDCLIDNATEEYWERMLALNLKCAFFTAQACIPALKSSKGCIVNVASVLGVMGGPPGSVVYSTTKHALVQMTRMMALELSSEGVRVNAIAPGWIDTPMIRRENELAGNNAVLKYIEGSCPMGRIGTVEECTGAILYLAAPFATYTTGATLCADGGLSSGHYF